MPQLSVQKNANQMQASFKLETTAALELERAWELRAGKCSDKPDASRQKCRKRFGWRSFRAG